MSGLPGEAEDPFNKVFEVDIQDASITEHDEQELPSDAFTTEAFDQKTVEDVVEPVAESKIHPLLQQWLTERGPDETESLIISLPQSLAIPRFPEPEPNEPRDSDTNRAALERAASIVGDLTSRRATEFDQFATAVAGLSVNETFWLIPAAVAEVRLGDVEALAAREDVAYIEPQISGESPPTTDSIDAGRRSIVSDPYFNLGQNGGWIGLLDTGVRFSHVLFNSPSLIDFRRDCVNGGADCNTGSSLNPVDDCWNHGTSSAAIIAGNNCLGDAFRGVAGITLDSFKVYPSTTSSTGACTGGLDQAAAVRGFQASVAALDRVIVAEMQGTGGTTSAIAVAANAAFDAGAVVIAANGNSGPNAGTVNVPALAHKVIGVGNFDVQTGAQVVSESRGPTPDGRFKPDVQAPTNAKSASNASDNATKVFGGTSGATPYAAGAAALLRNWLRGASFSLDPGQVYAQMILSGQQPYPFNNTSGGGPLQLPNNGRAWWGKVSVAKGATVDIPIRIGDPAAETFDAALWWPESPGQQHNDIDLNVIDPSGNSAASSVSVPSVYERARVSGPIAAGDWRVRIRGYSVPAGPQTVYWAAHVRHP